VSEGYADVGLSNVVQPRTPHPTRRGAQLPPLTVLELQTYSNQLSPAPFPYIIPHGPDSGYRSWEQEGDAAADVTGKLSPNTANFTADDGLWAQGFDANLFNTDCDTRYCDVADFLPKSGSSEHLELSEGEAEEDGES
jgi:hypothetical protein